MLCGSIASRSCAVVLLFCSITDHYLRSLSLGTARSHMCLWYIDKHTTLRME